MFAKKLLVAVLLVVLSVSFMSSAQEANEWETLYVWTTGQIDPADSSVLYSVLMTSGTEALTDVTVSAVLPEGATFVKDFWKPEAASFVGEQDGTVTWTLDAVDANAAAGPFTFVVSFEGSDSETFAPPATIKASLTSSAGTVESEVEEGVTLAKLATAGSLEVSPEGVLDFTAVEETGIWFYGAEGVVSDPVTLSFERLPVSEKETLPSVAEDTWWCGQIGITASSDVTLAKPIVLVIPLARASTPGTIMPVFAQAEGGEWELISAENSLTGAFAEEDLQAAAFARVSPSATTAYILLNSASFTTSSLKLAVGIDANIRNVSVQTVSAVNVGAIVVPNRISDPAPWF